MLAEGAADMRFSMRPGGNPGRRDFGGVIEAFTVPGSGRIELINRFGEPVAVDRAGTKVDFSVKLADARATAPMSRGRSSSTSASRRSARCSRAPAA